MKLIRVGPASAERPCILDDENVARDLSGIVSDFSADTLGDVLFSRLQALDLSTLPAVALDGARLGPPLAQPRNIYCVGLNYSDHAVEAGLPIPDEPILFNKASGTFCGPHDPILWIDNMTELDWEVELGIVIGEPAFAVSRDQALDHVFGFVVVNDVSERAWQMKRGGQWMKGKCFPHFCPTGPWLVTRDAIPDAQALGLWLTVNGERRQQGSTASMIFPVAEIVSYMSQFMRLERGDLICTGTPPGVGAGMKPPQFLRPGDIVALGIDGLGEQRQTVVPIETVSG